MAALMITYIATGVLGATFATLWRSLKLVLRKHRNVRAPSTEMENAATAFKRVRAEYMLLFTSSTLSTVRWALFGIQSVAGHLPLQQKLMQKLMQKSSAVQRSQFFVAPDCNAC